MRYASKKTEQGILPVMNPLFNLREICKQSALLEDHLNNPRKRCPDCIRKHFLTIEALYEEAVSLDKKYEYDEYLSDKAELVRGFQGVWLDAKDTDGYHQACRQISQDLRAMRKEYAPLCFDVRKMASKLDLRCFRCRLATLSQTEKEEREVERLVRKKPKKKPPRQDLRRNRVSQVDADLEGLGASDGGDRDLTMRSNKAASLKRWAVRVAAKKKKSLRGEIISKLSEDKKKKYRTKDGKKVSFSTAWSRPGTKEYESANSDVQKGLESHKKKEEDAKVIQEAKDARQDKEQREALMAGAKDALADNPANFLNLLRKGSKELSPEVMLDVLADMVSQEGFPLESLGLPKVVEDPEMVARHKKEKGEDDSKVGAGAMSEEEAAEREALRRDEANVDKEKQRGVLKSKLKSLIKRTKFPFDKKKEEARATLSKFSQVMRSLERSINDPAIAKTDEFKSTLVKQLNRKLKLGLSDQDDLDTIAKNISKWAKEKGLTAEEGFDSSNPLGEVLSLSADAKTKAHDLGVELEKEAIDLIESPTWKQIDLINSDMGLKLLSELRKANPTNYEIEQEKKNDPKARATAYKQTTKMIRNLIKNKQLTSRGGGREAKGLAKALEIIEGIPGKDSSEIPKDYLEEIAKGYDAASEEFKSFFGDETLSMGEILGKVAEKADELWDGDVEDKEGLELGVMLAASTMINAYAEDYEFNLPSSSEMVSSVKGGRRTRVTPNRVAVRNAISEQTMRFKSTTGERRRNALNYYTNKISESSSKADKVKYQAARDGVVVSMLLNGDKFLPSDVSPVDPFFLEHARNSNDPLAFEMVASASKMNKSMTPAKVRGIQKEYLDSLDDENFIQAIGGDNGPFKDFSELLKPDYCPDNPVNGSMAGQIIGPGDVCPLPLSPAHKEIIREHLSSLALDHYTVVPNAERADGDRFKKYEKGVDKKRQKTESELADYLKKNKKEYTRALFSPQGEKREVALAMLLLNMREANLENLEIGNWQDPSTKDQKVLQESRKKMILELIKKKDEKNVLDLLGQIDKELDTPVTTDASSMRLARHRNKYSSDRSFIQRRTLSDPLGAHLMNKYSSTYADYQSRAHQFHVGDRVFPFFVGNKDRSGLVVQLFPAIGMADVQFPHGVARYPVEDLVVDTSGDVKNISNIPDSVPGGRGVVPVSSGPSPKKVASRYLNSLKGR